jgi:hypothetical protein
MSVKFVLRGIGIFAAAALLITGIGLKSAIAMGSDNPPPPSDDSSSKKKKKKQNSVIEEQQRQIAQEKFLHDYRAARFLILSGDYQQGIAAMHALGHDEHPDVAMWQAEQGNRLKAEDYLQKVKLICGTTDCEEYRQLRAVIDGTASY